MKISWAAISVQQIDYGHIKNIETYKTAMDFSDNTMANLQINLNSKGQKKDFFVLSIIENVDILEKIH